VEDCPFSREHYLSDTGKAAKCGRVENAIAIAFEDVSLVARTVERVAGISRSRFSQDETVSALRLALAGRHAGRLNLPVSSHDDPAFVDELLNGDAELGRAELPLEDLRELNECGGCLSLSQSLEDLSLSNEVFRHRAPSTLRTFKILPQS
jgi:hypothetical protein